MRSALVLTRNSRDAVTQGHALHRNAVTQGHALHRNAVTQRHALLRDAVTQLTLSCASFSRASSSRFSARVWRHCLRELQLTHTQNANLQMRIRSRRQNAAVAAAASDLNLSPLDFLDPNQANDAGGRVKAY